MAVAHPVPEPEVNAEQLRPTQRTPFGTRIVCAVVKEPLFGHAATAPTPAGVVAGAESCKLNKN